MNLATLMRTCALPLVLSVGSALTGGCFLDRSAIVSPRPDAAGDGGLDGDGGLEPDGGLTDDAGGGMDGGAGPLIPGSRYVPGPLRPSDMGVLPPTRAFLLWRTGELPSGLSLTGYELCRTTGPASEIDDASECPNSALIAGLFLVVDPLAPNTTYRWKVRALFDDGRYSEWSAVNVFSSDDSLVAWLRLNGDATDSSMAGNDGIARNGAGFGGGIDGQALQCDGTDDYIDVGGGLTLPGPLTVSAWIYGNGIPTSSDSGIVNQGTLDYALTSHTDGRVYFYIGDGGNNLSAPVAPSAWHHVLGTFDGTTNPGGMRFYLDAVISGMRASSQATTGASGSLWIGRYNAGYFNGGIDNVTLYNVALSEAAVLNEFCAAQASGGVDPLPAECRP
ncbi:MAG TPA: LamG domain-containing protein [bacterium]|nr:LamG domain-containing protein [bacterium]